MTTNNPCPMHYASCIVARYDSGVSNYKKIERVCCLNASERKIRMSNVLNLLSADDKIAYIRVKQATAKGYISMHTGG